MDEMEKETHTCKCQKTEKLLCLTMLTNTVTSLALAVVAVALVIRMFAVQAPYPMNMGPRPQNNQAGQAEDNNLAGNRGAAHQNKIGREGNKKIFTKGFMSYEDAKKQNKKMLVLFYADWCPHCQKFGPTYQALSKDRQLKKVFNFVPLNSEDVSVRSLMEEYEIKGFPALYIVDLKKGQKTFVPNGLLFGENAEKELKKLLLDVK